MVNIIEHAKSHLTQIFLITSIFIISIIALRVFASDRNARMYVIVFMSFSYVLWGIIHHAIQKDLNIKIALEYIGFALLLSLSALLMLGWS